VPPALTSGRRSRGEVCRRAEVCRWGVRSAAGLRAAAGLRSAGSRAIPRFAVGDIHQVPQIVGLGKPRCPEWPESGCEVSTLVATRRGKTTKRAPSANRTGKHCGFATKRGTSREAGHNDPTKRGTSREAGHNDPTNRGTSAERVASLRGCADKTWHVGGAGGQSAGCAEPAEPAEPPDPADLRRRSDRRYSSLSTGSFESRSATEFSISFGRNG
jgi:hypothetical protein